MNIEFSCRLLAGFANSLLTGNVYMAECAPSHLVPSLKQVEVISFDVFPFYCVLVLCCHPEFGLSTQAASRSMGAILIFAFNVIFVSVFVTLSLLATSYLLLPFLAPSVFKRASFLHRG